MKFSEKYLIIFAILFAVTGCASNKNQVNKDEENIEITTSTDENTNKQSKEELNNKEESVDDVYDTSQTVEDGIVRLTTTTSVNDSGLMEYLRDGLREDTGLEMEIVSKGTGAALEDAKQGNADVILVHSKPAEEEFIDQGYGIERKPFMYNYFVIVGPADDPANIKGKESEEAFKLINDNGASFISRGDDSGTHKKEINLWESAGVNLDELELKDNYSSLGDGMGATLTFASENQAYTLTDLATFLSMNNNLDLEVLIDQSESLKNIYSVIVINPDKVEGTNLENANKFQDWMLSDKARELISEYGVDEYGQQLFFVGD